MRRKIHYFSLFLVVCLTITAWGSSSAPSAAVKNGDVATAAPDTKISKELRSVLDISEDEDMIPVYIWTDDIDYQTVERKTAQASGFSKDALMKNSNNLYEPLTRSLAPDIMTNTAAQDSVAAMSSKDYETAVNLTKADTLCLIKDFYQEHQEELAELSDSIDLYVDTRRSLAREAYHKQNSEFARNYLKDATIIFQSEYAPMIICKLSKRDILTLDAASAVDLLSLYEELEFADTGNIDVGVKSIKGDYTRDSIGLDGYGVKIGQIETGCPETGIAELANTQITRHANNFGSPHASLVAAIIAGQTGMAPQAELYSTQLGGTDFYANAEWLISSGVSVINMSARHSENYEIYSTKARWVDHIVYQHGVTWVSAAGNCEAGPYVVSPGNAYNVITVGGIDDHGTITTVDDTFFEQSSCQTGVGMPSKPDVVAPATGFSLSGGTIKDGTSFAAPYVTGMVAQIMSFCPTLKFRPDAIKAAVVASCDRKTSGESISCITNKEGSGVVNAKNAANSLSNVLTQNTYHTTSDQTITFDFYPLTTGTKTIAITWLKQNTGMGTNHEAIADNTFSNFDLFVYDSNGRLVASSTSSYNSVEMVRFNAATTGKYTVKIRKITGGTTTEKISLAHVRS